MVSITFDTLDDDGHHLICSICADGGDVVLCDSCPKVYHESCLTWFGKIPDEGAWYCPVCVGVEMPKDAAIVSWSIITGTPLSIPKSKSNRGTTNASGSGKVKLTETVSPPSAPDKLTDNASPSHYIPSIELFPPQTLRMFPIPKSIIIDTALEGHITLRQYEDGVFSVSDGSLEFPLSRLWSFYYSPNVLPHTLVVNDELEPPKTDKLVAINTCNGLGEFREFFGKRHSLRTRVKSPIAPPIVTLATVVDMVTIPARYWCVDMGPSGWTCNASCAMRNLFREWKLFYFRYKDKLISPPAEKERSFPGNVSSTFAPENLHGTLRISLQHSLPIHDSSSDMADRNTLSLPGSDSASTSLPLQMPHPLSLAKYKRPPLLPVDSFDIGGSTPSLLETASLGPSTPNFIASTFLSSTLLPATSAAPDLTPLPYSMSNMTLLPPPFPSTPFESIATHDDSKRAVETRNLSASEVASNPLGLDSNQFDAMSASVSHTLLSSSVTSNTMSLLSSCENSSFMKHDQASHTGRKNSLGGHSTCESIEMDKEGSIRLRRICSISAETCSPTLQPGELSLAPAVSRSSSNPLEPLNAMHHTKPLDTSLHTSLSLDKAIATMETLPCMHCISHPCQCASIVVTSNAKVLPEGSNPSLETESIHRNLQTSAVNPNSEAPNAKKHGAVSHAPSETTASLAQPTPPQKPRNILVLRKRSRDLSTELCSALIKEPKRTDSSHAVLPTNDSTAVASRAINPTAQTVSVAANANLGISTPAPAPLTNPVLSSVPITASISSVSSRPSVPSGVSLRSASRGSIQDLQSLLVDISTAYLEAFRATIPQLSISLHSRANGFPEYVQSHLDRHCQFCGLDLSAAPSTAASSISNKLPPTIQPDSIGSTLIPTTTTVTTKQDPLLTATRHDPLSKLSLFHSPVSSGISYLSDTLSPPPLRSLPRFASPPLSMQRSRPAVSALSPYLTYNQDILREGTSIKRMLFCDFDSLADDLEDASNARGLEVTQQSLPIPSMPPALSDSVTRVHVHATSTPKTRRADISSLREASSGSSIHTPSVDAPSLQNASSSPTLQGEDTVSEAYPSIVKTPDSVAKQDTRQVLLRLVANILRERLFTFCLVCGEEIYPADASLIKSASWTKSVHASFRTLPTLCLVLIYGILMQLSTFSYAKLEAVLGNEEVAKADSGTSPAVGSATASQATKREVHSPLALQPDGKSMFDMFVERVQAESEREKVDPQLQRGASTSTTTLPRKAANSDGATAARARQDNNYDTTQLSTTIKTLFDNVSTGWSQLVSFPSRTSTDGTAITSMVSNSFNLSEKMDHFSHFFASVLRVDFECNNVAEQPVSAAPTLVSPPSTARFRCAVSMLMMTSFPVYLCVTSNVYAESQEVANQHLQQVLQSDSLESLFFHAVRHTPNEA